VDSRLRGNERWYASCAATATWLVFWKVVMTRFPCPYLKRDVELTTEREEHIRERHPDLLPKHRAASGTPWLTQIVCG